MRAKKIPARRRGTKKKRADQCPQEETVPINEPELQKETMIDDMDVELVPPPLSPCIETLLLISQSNDPQY